MGGTDAITQAAKWKVYHGFVAVSGIRGKVDRTAVWQHCGYMA